MFRTLDEVGEDALVAAIQRVTTGTLDRSLQRDLRLLGPERAAREEFHYARAMLYKLGRWRLAYIPKGTLAGLIMVAENDGGPIIYYIGVVPEQRGRGYVDDLLVEGTLLLQAEGATRIITDTDTENAPMGRAFERAGYRKFGTRLDYAIQLTRLHEDVD